MKKVKLLEFSLPVTFLREGRNFVAYSPVLDLSTSARSFDLAKKRFFEAVDIFLEELSNKGTLDEILFQLGWARSANFRVLKVA